MRVHESLRPNESESGQEFRLFESASELMRVYESLRPKRASVDESSGDSENA